MLNNPSKTTERWETKTSDWWGSCDWSWSHQWCWKIGPEWFGPSFDPQREWIGNYMVKTWTTANRDCCIEENSALRMRWRQGFCLQCVTVMWFMSCLGGIHDISWFITHYLSRNWASCSNCPSQGELSSLRRCWQWGGQEGAALGQLLRAGATQLSRGFRWDTLESGQGEGFVVDFWLFGFLKKFYFKWPAVCLFTSHFCNSNGSQMLMKLCDDSLSKCQK